MGTGYAAYTRAGADALKGRILEGAALTKAAHLLEQARNRPNDAVTLGRALRFNNKLWTVFQADLSEKDSPLPDKLRGELLSLGLFMDTTTARLLDHGFDDEAVQAMIDVNRSLAAALFNG